MFATVEWRLSITHMQMRLLVRWLCGMKAWMKLSKSVNTPITLPCPRVVNGCGHGLIIQLLTMQIALKYITYWLPLISTTDNICEPIATWQTLLHGASSLMELPEWLQHYYSILAMWSWQWCIILGWYLFNIWYSYNDCLEGLWGFVPWRPAAGIKNSLKLSAVCFKVVINLWRSPVRQFARARIIDEYDVKMPVPHVRVTSLINCGDVTMLSQKRPSLATMAKSAIDNCFWHNCVFRTSNSV